MSTLPCQKGPERKHIMLSIHPFNLFSTASPLLGPKGAPAHPRRLRVWGRVHPGQVPSSAQGNTKTNILSQSRLTRCSTTPAEGAMLCSSHQEGSGRIFYAFSWKARERSLLVIKVLGNVGGRDALWCFYFKSI